MATQKEYKYLCKVLTLPDGSRKYIRAKTQEELDEKVMDAEIMLRAGVDLASKETFGHFAQMWYRNYKEPYLRENSKIAIKYTLNQYVLPVLGSCLLRDITPMQIQGIMASMRDKSNSLQSKVLINLRSIFDAAVDNGLIAKSPVGLMIRAKGKKTEEKVALTPQETALLLEKVTNRRAHTFLMIALHTGMRRAEIAALQWTDIDFKEKVIHVRHNALLGRGGQPTTVSTEMKTSAGKRDLPLSEELEKCLYAEKRLSHSKYVIAMQNHLPLTQSSYTSMWKLIDRELPTRHITAHILRHTYITRLFEEHLDIKEIQYLAGHSSIDMTLQVYTHYDRLSRADATAEKVRAAMKHI